MTALHVQDVDLVVPTLQAWVQEVLCLFLYGLDLLRLWLYLSPVLVGFYLLKLLESLFLVLHIFLVEVLFEGFLLLLCDFCDGDTGFFLYYFFVEGMDLNEVAEIIHGDV